VWLQKYGVYDGVCVYRKRGGGGEKKKKKGGMWGGGGGDEKVNKVGKLENCNKRSYTTIRKKGLVLTKLMLIWEDPSLCNTFNRSDSPIQSPVQVGRKIIYHTSVVSVRKRGTSIVTSRILFSPQGLQLQVRSVSQVVHTQLKTKTSPIL